MPVWSILINWRQHRSCALQCDELGSITPSERSLGLQPRRRLANREGSSIEAAEKTQTGVIFGNMTLLCPFWESWPRIMSIQRSSFKNTLTNRWVHLNDCKIDVHETMTNNVRLEGSGGHIYLLCRLMDFEMQLFGLHAFTYDAVRTYGSEERCQNVPTNWDLHTGLPQTLETRSTYWTKSVGDYMRRVEPVNRAGPLRIYIVCFFNTLITWKPGKPALLGSRLLHTGRTRLRLPCTFRGVSSLMDVAHAPYITDILTQYKIKAYKICCKKIAILFDSNELYVPEVDPITGDVFHEREDHCHILLNASGRIQWKEVQITLM